MRTRTLTPEEHAVAVVARHLDVIEKCGRAEGIESIADLRKFLRIDFADIYRPEAVGTIGVDEAADEPGQQM